MYGTDPGLFACAAHQNPDGLTQLFGAEAVPSGLRMHNGQRLQAWNFELVRDSVVVGARAGDSTKGKAARKKEKKRKVYAVRRYNGSLCTQKQPETAAFRALKAATRKGKQKDPKGGQPAMLCYKSTLQS